MSGEELALQTQLLLQEATQINALAAVEVVVDGAGAPSPVNEFETAKQALLAKLKRKKETSRAQLQKLNQQRFGPQATHTLGSKQADAGLLSPRKMLRLPVASAAPAASRKKQDMLAKLRTQAIRQGAEKKAKFFGYASYDEQIKKLNEIEKKKMRLEEKKTQETNKKALEQEEEAKEAEDEPMDLSAEMECAAAVHGDDETGRMDEADAAEETVASPKVVSEAAVSPETATAEKSDNSEEGAGESVKVVRRRNRIHRDDAEEKDGNEADSEQDDKPDDADEVMEDVDDEKTAKPEADAGDNTPVKSVAPKDKAAGYRNLLRAEALQNRKRKRLVKGRGDNFVESEAEEEEEEDALKIGGLGDFGFGVPQAKTQEAREAEEERHALKLREGDLDHIVDDLSDEERAQEQDLEEMFRREQEDQDRQQVKEVMRNVKQGFGRNRRAFSGLNSESGARGRFNLDELVAADGDKFEAARLGLLESDEELSDEDGKKKTKKLNSDGGEVEDEEEEDEEAEMERMLRERFMNQPKIYVTSSESGSDEEEENEPKKDNGPDGDEVQSDEERERQQMKLFSERARINRRMQRMKDMQRQIALENNEADPTSKTGAAMPNVLLEEDEDSQELMQLLSRTDVDAIPGSQPTAQHVKRTERGRPQLGRFHSYGGMTSASGSSSSFSRVIGHCKLFSGHSTASASPSKGFVFTSFSSDKAEEGGDENAVPNVDEATPSARPELGKSKSWSGAKVTATKRRGGPGPAGAASKKRKSGGGLFSVLSSYQCVSSTSQSQE